MIINPKFNYPKVERVTNEDGTRFYTCPVTGAPLPSVTTILSATSDKTALILWEKAVGKKKADAVRTEACNLGSLMHQNLENTLQGLPHEPGSHPLRMQASRMATVVEQKGFPQIDEVWGMEVAMYIPGLYAGMTDLVGVHVKEEAIIDHKTTKKMKRFEDIEDYKCQTGAYSLSHNETYGTKINKGVIFMVARDLEFKEYVLDRLQMRHYEGEFLRRCEMYLNANH